MGFFISFFTGRHAVTNNLNLEALGVEVDQTTQKVFGGHSDDHERTSVANIYAIGDILHVSNSLLKLNYWGQTAHKNGDICWARPLHVLSWSIIHVKI